MPPAVNIVGQKYGRWTVVARNYMIHKETMWDCVCECGTKATITASNLRGGKSKSCGCLRKEVLSDIKTTHGQTHTEAYHSWQQMKSRCYNPNDHKYPDYGGRGITVCDRWLNSFENFLADVGSPPSPAHTIDRYPNNDGNYEPGNVKWSTPAEQALNKRNNRKFTYKGETKTVKEWSVALNIPYGTLYSRLVTYGMTVEKALTIPVRKWGR